MVELFSIFITFQSVGSLIQSFHQLGWEICVGAAVFSLVRESINQNFGR